MNHTPTQPAKRPAATANEPQAEHTAESTLLQPEERVLSTLEADGTRRWLKPRVSPGRFFNRRRIVAYFLIALFTLLPYIPINGKPAILLDILNREFTILGYTFLPTDTLPLALFALSVLISIFLLTALFGRVWCGWACPQTVYMEYVFRPIERLFEGTAGRGGTAKRAVAGWRKVARIVVYFLISFYLAHTFLAYFVGVANLRQWVFGSPLDHPVAFLVVMAVTGLMMFDFVYFREQLCIVACPYGRLQSVLLDRQSLIVTYDESRGEPRGKHKPKEGESRGDCIDCEMCVSTCPTGIDIRDGLQLECIHCAQCIDACDAIMTKVNKPTGLIRYSSQEAVEEGRRRLFRPRVILYPAVLAVLFTALLVTLTTKSEVDASVLRSAGALHTISEGKVVNRLRLKLTNRTDRAATYTVAVVDEPRITLRLTEKQLTVEPGRIHRVGLIVYAEPELFVNGTAMVDLAIRNGEHEVKRIRTPLVGPDRVEPTP